jgi:hypothetical protein
MTAAEIRAIIEQLTSIATVIRSAEPADKAEIYKGLNLASTYKPASAAIRGEDAGQPGFP